MSQNVTDWPTAKTPRIAWFARARRGSAGVELIQIRERDLEANGLTSLVRRCVDAVGGTRARVLVNDRLDVALAAGAHGVHLRSDSIEARRVPELLPAGALVGRSVHTAAEAASIAREGVVDYLIFRHTVSDAVETGTLSALAVAGAGSGNRYSPRHRSGCWRSARCAVAVERWAAAGGPGAAGIPTIGLFIPAAGRGVAARCPRQERAVAQPLSRAPWLSTQSKAMP